MTFKSPPRQAAPKGHKPKRRYGQNYLIDRIVVHQIIEAAELTPADQVLEIGPGPGTLTQDIAHAAGSVVAVELDASLAQFLSPLEVVNPNLKVVYQDFIKTEWAALPFDHERPIKVVGNIPYYITTPILLKLLQATRLEKEPLTSVKPWAERILLMVQWEVARRLVATPGGKDYGSLSLIAQYASEVTIVTKVKAAAFRPRPTVDSAVVLLKPRVVPAVEVNNAPLMFRAIRGSFQQRRKTLRNGMLATGFLLEQLEAAAASLKLDLGRRAETLSLAEFAALTNALEAHGAS
jgi:16S rRNA (adenine1518-N6/adenine1519-N6)-dimethyltransferase